MKIEYLDNLLLNCSCILNEILELCNDNPDERGFFWGVFREIIANINQKRMEVLGYESL